MTQHNASWLRQRQGWELSRLEKYGWYGHWWCWAVSAQLMQAVCEGTATVWQVGG
jgi:hypothetical protein